jgi:geranylgeranyl diphosphate synthase type II
MRPEKSLLLKKAIVEGELVCLLSRRDTKLYQAMHYSVLSGGKRFRPLLAMASGACFGVRRNIILPFACALELIHNYSLIHDDLPSMDDDDLRRGQPSCHRAFGEDIALLAGDGLLTLAFEVMAGARVPGRLLAAKQEAILMLSRRAGVDGMIGGQWLDISLNPRELTKKLLDETIAQKTGALIEGSVLVGAVLGRAGTAEQEAVSDFGKTLGLAFQIRDDLLDFRGRPKGRDLVRPDHAAFFGPSDSEKRLRELVRRAASSLDRFADRAAELRYLAFSLLDSGPEAQHA